MKKTEEKKNNITEVVFILDRSGSMGGFESDTVGGFNATVEKQKKLEGEVFVSTILFDTETEVLHDRLPIGEVKPMTEKEYSVGGCTALLDAVGNAVRHIEKVHRYIRKEDVPSHTVFVITTDGEENASREYSSSAVKNLIKEKTDKDGWEFIFMASNIDAAENAEAIGIDRTRAVNSHQTGRGIKAQYCAMSNAISAVRKCRSLEDTSWRAEADEEFRN